MRPLSIFLDCCRHGSELLEDHVLAERWDAPSALSDWTVGGLAGHFARSVFNLRAAVEMVPPPTAILLSAVDYYTENRPQPAGSAVGRRIRELGDLEAAAGPSILARRFGDAINDLELQLAGGELPQAATLFGAPMPLDECATACLLELIVHADDLAVSVDLTMPKFDSAAVELVASTLACISARRYGVTVVRALARPERAPDAISVF